MKRTYVLIGYGGLQWQRNSIMPVSYTHLDPQGKEESLLQPAGGGRYGSEDPQGIRPVRGGRTYHQRACAG